MNLTEWSGRPLKIESKWHEAAHSDGETLGNSAAPVHHENQFTAVGGKCCRSQAASVGAMKRVVLAALTTICLVSPLAAQAPAAGNDPNRPFSAPLQAGLNALERKHYSTALRAWQPMANSGEPRAQNNMGIMYERGLGVTQSYPEAMSWYRKAADQGLPEAQFNLGQLYHNGYGTEVNNGQAVAWFQRAASQGLADAEYMLGLHLYSGKGIRKDPLAAKVQFMKAARKGYVNAQFMTGYLFLDEQAGKQDFVAAHIWAIVSQMNGYQGAEEILNFTTFKLERTQIDRAHLAARRCLNSGYRECPQ